MTAICQMSLTFRQMGPSWLCDSVALYEDWSAKNHGQVYACKVYLELQVLVSLVYFKYSSHAV